MTQTPLSPYSGPKAKGRNARTLTGKLMCGYQGWFNAPGDGTDRGWVHWGPGVFRQGRLNVEMWPDVSELDPDERFPTEFRHADGRVAEVFSSYKQKTVLRHFKWMRDYGIDGAFVQRFAVSVFDRSGAIHNDAVLSHCREGANRHDRTYAVMYDLSGMRGGQIGRLKDDWRKLIEQMQITRDPAYQRHNGKPVVSVWGLGFNDGRQYTLDEGLELIDFLRNDKVCGGNTVKLGVPTYWRTLDRDCLNDPKVHDLLRAADIVSPWTVGRFGTPEDATRFGATVMAPDIEWCRKAGKEYIPVAFPGFSWSNMRHGAADAPFNQIPRRDGAFLWAQYVAAKRAGATMLYQAMFDEVDEGTAIFKVTNDPPVGEARFVTNGAQTDRFLWLAGEGGKLIRQKGPVADAMPVRKPAP